MKAPNDRRYSKEHEWARAQGAIATVGITAFAAESLGDIVFVDLPEVGTQVSRMAKFGEVESVKAVSDLFSPVTGTVVERNEALIDNPEIVNQDPYTDGWLLKVEMSDPSEVESLLDAEAYDKHAAEAA